MMLRVGIARGSRHAHQGALRIFILVQMVLASCVLPLSVSNAEPPTAKIIGLGAATCAQFVIDTKQSPQVERDYFAWAQGFMSGILMGRPPGVDEGLDLAPSTFPLHKQLEFLRDHCQRNPRNDFTDAVAALYKRLRKEGAT